MMTQRNSTRFCLASVALALLWGCDTSPTLNAGSDEAFKSSIEVMMSTLPLDERDMLSEQITLVAQYEADKILSRTHSRDANQPNPTDVIRAKFNGLNAKDIQKLAGKIELRIGIPSSEG